LANPAWESGLDSDDSENSQFPPLLITTTTAS
jgi:hypothetical protein